MPLHHLAPALTATVFALALVACGGGGGDAPTADAASASAAAASGAASGANTGRTVATATCGLPDFQASAMARINQWRASGADCHTRGTFAPAAALVWNDRLTQAGTAHSADMVAGNYFDHTGSDGSNVGTRTTAAGYTWRTVGENIAAGYPTVNAVVDGWIASDGHCANLMNPAFVDVGLACVSAPATNSYRTYWTMVLAAPR